MKVYNELEGVGAEGKKIAQLFVNVLEFNKYTINELHTSNPTNIVFIGIEASGVSVATILKDEAIDIFSKQDKSDVSTEIKTAICYMKLQAYMPNRYLVLLIRHGKFLTFVMRETIGDIGIVYSSILAVGFDICRGCCNQVLHRC